MTPRENALRAYRHKMPESIPNFFTDFDIWDSYGERYFGTGTGEDWFGVSWTHIPEMHSQTETPGQAQMESLEDWRERIQLPRLEDYDWERIAAEATAGWDRENRVSFCMLLNGPFERMMSLMGFENAMYAFYDNPDEVHQLFQAVTEHKCRYLERLKKHFNFDVIAFHDDWGDNKNAFFSLEMWREFLKPYIKRVIDKTHALGMLFEMHSCGYVRPFLTDLAELGVDGVDPLQACNGLEEIKAELGGRFLLNGGFRSQDVLERPGATEAEIRAEVRRNIDMLAPGGHFGTMCPIIDQRVAAIVADEISTYGKGYYQRINQTEKVGLV